MKERLPVERREILSIPLRKGEKEGVDEWPQTQKKCSANHSDGVFIVGIGKGNITTHGSDIDRRHRTRGRGTSIRTSVRRSSLRRWRRRRGSTIRRKGSRARTFLLLLLGSNALAVFSQPLIVTRGVVVTPTSTMRTFAAPKFLTTRIRINTIRRFTIGRSTTVNVFRSTRTRNRRTRCNRRCRD